MGSKYSLYAILLTILAIVIIITKEHYRYKRIEGKKRAVVYYAAQANEPCKEVIKFIKENL